MRRFNSRFAAILALSCLTIAVSIHLIHRMQVGKNADFLLAEAQAAQANGDYDAAIDFYGRYLRYRPDDDEAYISMTMLSSDRAASSTANRRQLDDAYFALEEAVRRTPEDSQLRRRLVEFALRPTVRQLSAARDHLEHLLSASPNDPELLTLLAQVEYQSGSAAEALDICSRLIGYVPSEAEFNSQAVAAGQLDAYETLAAVLHSRMQAEDAIRVMEQMAVNNPSSHDAHLRLGVFLLQFHGSSKPRREQAQEALVTALQIAPDDPTVILARSEAVTAGGDTNDFAHAREHLLRGLKLYPDNPLFYRQLSRLAALERNVEQARVHLNEGLKHSPGNPLLLERLIDVELDLQDAAAAKETLQLLKPADVGPGAIQFAEARLALLEGDYAIAANSLEQLRKTGTLAHHQYRIDLFLGQAYQWLGQADLMLDAFERYRAAEPSSATASLGTAQGLVMLGRPQQAREIYESVARAGLESLQAYPGAIDTYLNLLIAEQAKSSANEANWKRLSSLLDQLRKKDLVSDAQYSIIAAEILARQDKLGEARSVLREAIEKSTREERLWLALARLELFDTQRDRPQRIAASQTILDEARKVAGDTLPLLSFEADLLAEQRPNDPDPLVAALESRAKGFNASDQAAFWKKLGDVSYLLRQPVLARDYWRRTAEARSSDVGVRLQLFELARETGDADAMNKLIDQVTRIVGSDNSLTCYMNAAKLTALAARDQQQQQLEEVERAEGLIDKVLQERPNWTAALKVKTDIELLQQDTASAIAQLERMAGSGASSPAILRPLVQLLVKANRPGEAKPYLDRLPQEARSGLERLGAEIEFAVGNVDAGLDQARSLSERSGSAADLYWYGVRSAQAGKAPQAEEALRAAVQKDPAMGEAWLALVGHLVSAKMRSEAEDVLAEAERKLPKESAAAILARGYELVGNRSKADSNYQRAITSRPNDFALRRDAITYYTRTDRREIARESVQALILRASNSPEHAADLAWGRRALAELLAVAGSYRDHLAALKLVDANQSEGISTDEDLRVRAMLLSRRGDLGSQREAIAILEDLNGRNALQDDGRLRLARLYDRTGDRTRARQTMLSLLASESQAYNAALIAEFIDMLLRQKDVAEAATWLSRLERLQPDAAEPVVLRARLLLQQDDESGKHAEEATQLLRQLAERNSGFTPLMAAKLLEQWEQFESADNLYRVQAQSGEDDAVLAMAAFLGRRGRTEETFQTLEKHASAIGHASRIRVGMDALQHAEGDLQEYAGIVKRWIDEGLKNEPGKLTIELMRAELLHNYYHDYDAVAETYRGLLRRDNLSTQQRAVAANNLAVLLAIRLGQGEESLALVKEAMSFFGPVSDVLDTRAMGHLAAGNSKAAIADLKEAIAGSGDSPLKHFHLALAHQAAGDSKSAADALTRAHALNLKVPELERERYNQLVQALGM